MPQDEKFYVFQKKEEPKPPKPKLILFGLITLLWVAGMVLIFTGGGTSNLSAAGYACWGVSFMLGLIVYIFQRHKTTLDDVREAEMLADLKPTEEAEKTDNNEKP